jgi:hypothetical protein
MQSHWFIYFVKKCGLVLYRFAAPEEVFLVTLLVGFPEKLTVSQARDSLPFTERKSTRECSKKSVAGHHPEPN